ncbi:precorrin-3B synthase [Pseudorhizobium tarimense]|uniref:Precorrin-3B synthase n=2 Tax=Pseudorhizobium tarimense TaxID=1079109 RepID=A0ABV2H541_9HYPH|nr:precorrin-3B synthase [Pseudorhizobium tarimense]
MQTGDGLLARVALTDAISPRQLSGMCRLASQHGNGIIDISARGNIQVRGLTETSAPLLDQDVRAMNLPLRSGLAVEVPPFAGLDPTEAADPRELATAIAEGAKDIQGLAPKMSVIVDGSGRFKLSNLLADIRLVAMPPAEGDGWMILLGGTEATAGLYGKVGTTADATAQVLDLLRRLAALGPSVRGRDLVEAGMERRHSPASASPLGLHPLSTEQYALGLSPAFGQLTARELAALCVAAANAGIPTVKPALDHSLIFFGGLQACQSLQHYAASEGFITVANDPRGAIAACPGSPACASATLATHDLAAHAVDEFGALLDGSFKLHITGCPKGCAFPQTSPLTLCGTAASISFIAGRASDAPFVAVKQVDVLTSLRRTAALLRSERREGESSAACLARLKPEQLADHITTGS